MAVASEHPDGVPCSGSLPLAFASRQGVIASYTVQDVYLLSRGKRTTVIYLGSSYLPLSSRSAAVNPIVVPRVGVERGIPGISKNAGARGELTPGGVRAASPHTTIS